MNEHEAYLKGCNDANSKRQEQDDKWNNYYRKFDANLSGKMKDHEAKYVMPLKEKEMVEQNKLVK